MHRATLALGTASFATLKQINNNIIEFQIKSIKSEKHKPFYYNQQ